MIIWYRYSIKTGIDSNNHFYDWVEIQNIKLQYIIIVKYLTTIVELKARSQYRMLEHRTSKNNRKSLIIKDMCTIIILLIRNVIYLFL